jgi:NADH-quinone oxidoreductase subunit M
VLSTFGVVLGAWYMLYLVQRVFFGPLKEPVHDHGPISHGYSAEQPHEHGAVRVHRDPGQGDSEHTNAHPASDAAADHAAHHQAAHHHDDHQSGYAPLPPGPIDMTLREVLAIAPLVVFIFWIGLYPKFFLEYLAPAVNPIGAEVNEYVFAEHGPPQERESARPLVASGEAQP